ncbi:MAG: HAMP domain-containing sensor histidine kinase [Haliangium ochraceum]
MSRRRRARHRRDGRFFDDVAAACDPAGERAEWHEGLSRGDGGAGGHDGHDDDRGKVDAARWPHPFHEHRDFHRRFHRALWLRHRWRRFSGVHLRRRLFLWFGATIFLTTVVVASMAHLTRGGQGGHQIPGVVFVLVPAAILWAATGKVARRIARPLDELVGVAQDIGAGRLDARARLHRVGIDEIAALSRAVNDMAARIERQVSDQRELLAGVSHEIRTPLARLRLLVEIGREQGPQATNLDEIEREVIEIDALVGELLASARLDFSALTPMPLDAGEVAARAAERAGVPSTSVTISAGDRAFVGDPTLLARALANLLKNAAVHGGGVDRLRVDVGSAGAVVFTVLDRGPGFPAGDEDRVFDRFFRSGPAGPARADGLGLGLALVRRIAEGHGGTVAARNRADRDGGEIPSGAEVSISLPRGGSRPV